MVQKTRVRLRRWVVSERIGEKRARSIREISAEEADESAQVVVDVGEVVTEDSTQPIANGSNAHHVAIRSILHSDASESEEDSSHDEELDESNVPTFDGPPRTPQSRVPPRTPSAARTRKEVFSSPSIQRMLHHSRKRRNLASSIHVRYLDFARRGEVEWTLQGERTKSQIARFVAEELLQSSGPVDDDTEELLVLEKSLCVYSVHSNGEVKVYTSDNAPVASWKCHVYVHESISLRQFFLDERSGHASVLVPPTQHPIHHLHCVQTRFGIKLRHVFVPYCASTIREAIELIEPTNPFQQASLLRLRRMHLAMRQRGGFAVTTHGSSGEMLPFPTKVQGNDVVSSRELLSSSDDINRPLSGAFAFVHPQCSRGDLVSFRSSAQSEPFELAAITSVGTPDNMAALVEVESIVTGRLHRIPFFDVAHV